MSLVRAATLEHSFGRAERRRSLDVTGPLFIGWLVIVAFLFGGLGWASVAPITKGATVQGALIVESKTKAVQHGKGGNVRRIHVTENQDVAEGQLLVTLDETDIREQLRAVAGQMQAAQRELQILDQELAIIRDLVARQLTPRPRLAELERQAVALEKELAAGQGRIATLGQDLKRTRIRAPSSGRVLSLAVTGTGAVVAPGGAVAQIVPLNDRLVVEGRLAANDIDGLHPGMPAKVWLSALNRREADPLAGTLASISPDALEDKAGGQSHYLVRVELDASRSEIESRTKLYPGMRTEILIVKGTTTLLDRLLDPLLKGLGRSFRAH
jgi:multidrug efflux pump subunit AcrA (membrane-fusion protein)